MQAIWCICILLFYTLKMWHLYEPNFPYQTLFVNHLKRYNKYCTYKYKYNCHNKVHATCDADFMHNLLSNQKIRSGIQDFYEYFKLSNYRTRVQPSWLLSLLSSWSTVLLPQFERVNNPNESSTNTVPNTCYNVRFPRTFSTVITKATLYITCQCYSTFRSVILLYFLLSNVPSTRSHEK